MQNTNLDNLNEDRSLFNFEAGQKCSQSQTRADSARPFEVEEEDDDDEIPLDSSCRLAVVVRHISCTC